jgi:hypothetical protein
MAQPTIIHVDLEKPFVKTSGLPLASGPRHESEGSAGEGGIRGWVPAQRGIWEMSELRRMRANAGPPRSEHQHRHPVPRGDLRSGAKWPRAQNCAAGAEEAHCIASAISHAVQPRAEVCPR